MLEEQKKEIEAEDGDKEEKTEASVLEQCRKERDEYLDGWKRAKADLINYKKEEAKRFETIVKFSNEALVKDLINVLDSFDLALAALESRTRNDAEQTRTDAEKKVLRGMYLIRTQMEDILRKNGLEPVVVSVGQQFNPALQMAIASVESDKPSGTVVEEVERGYLLNGKLIRPARVKVAK